ncbi:MAG: hypothetical protein UX94_C0001G0017 [Parcubacteria group bacterium GW2011_GWA2_47_21]|nr:MAG: hypothetical protein UX94_C0001G0017 [Parcubacteria group bacterium GW2011_GWA2_47_21]
MFRNSKLMGVFEVRPYKLTFLIIFVKKRLGHEDKVGRFSRYFQLHKVDKIE